MTTSTRDRDHLIATHIDIARRISMRMARRCPSWISADDLVAAGMLGLVSAAERFDASRGEPFLGFAEKRIRGAVLDELRRGDMMPRRVRTMARKVGTTIAALEQQHGGPVDDAKVAEALGVSVEHYRADLEQLVHVTVGALDDLEHAPPVSQDSSPAATAERRLLLERVRAAISSLGERDVLVLSLYYNEELTYIEIGKVLGITSSRVCQLHGRAVQRIRDMVDPG